MKNHAKGNNVMNTRYRRRHGLDAENEESKRFSHVIGFNLDSCLNKNMAGLKRGKKGK